MPSRKSSRSSRPAMSMLPNWMTQVTPFSKSLAMTMFVILPFIFFLIGMKYQRELMGDTVPFEIVIRKACTDAPTSADRMKQAAVKPGMMSPQPTPMMRGAY